MRPLVSVLKVYLSQQNLDKVFSGGLGSYRLYVLVAAFCERRERLSEGYFYQDTRGGANSGANSGAVGGADGGSSSTYPGFDDTFVWPPVAPAPSRDEGGEGRKLAPASTPSSAAPSTAQPPATSSEQGSNAPTPRPTPAPTDFGSLLIEFLAYHRNSRHLNRFTSVVVGEHSADFEAVTRVAQITEAFGAAHDALLDADHEERQRHQHPTSQPTDRRTDRRTGRRTDRRGGWGASGRAPAARGVLQEIIAVEQLQTERDESLASSRKAVREAAAAAAAAACQDAASRAEGADSQEGSPVAERRGLSFRARADTEEVQADAGGSSDGSADAGLEGDREGEPRSSPPEGGTKRRKRTAASAVRCAIALLGPGALPLRRRQKPMVQF